MADLVAQQLNNDPLLQHVMQTVDGQARPVVGGIQLLSKVGEGSTGAVYRAQHPTLNREVAVKVMLFPDEKSIRFQKFMAHAQSAKNVKHKRLIEVIDAATQSGLVYVVSELFDSTSADKHLQKLKERLKPGLPETSLLNLALATAEGLAAAHQSDVVHLDIRPSTLLIPKASNGDLAFGEAKLGDLGQAYNEFVGRFLIGTSAETGMPGYMSPEQAMGIENPGKASDVFSFGATIYALLVGQSPFGGLTIDNVISATLHQPIGDVRTWRPDVSRATSKIVEICLRKHPAARFADARVLLQALQISLDSLDCGIDIQQAAVEEIDSLVKSHSSANLPAASIMPAENVADKHAQAAASYVTLPVLPPSNTGIAARPSALSPNAAAPAAPVAAAAEVPPAPKPKPITAKPSVPPPPAESAASEPTLITSMATQPPKKATELFIDAKKPAGAGSQIIPLNPAASSKLPTVPASTAPRTATKVVAIKPAAQAAATTEWVDPTVQPEEAEPPKKKSGATGILVAALLLAAVGAGAWKMGYLPFGKKPVIAQKKAGPEPVTKNDPATKTGDPATKTGDPATKVDDPATKVADPATKVTDPATKVADPATKTDDAAKKAEEEKRLAAEKEKEEQAKREAAAKAEQERLAAEAAKKLEEEKKAAEAKLKAEEEAKLAEALKAKEEAERVAKELEAKRQKEEQEAAIALAAKKAEEEKKAKEAEEARLAKLKQEEEQRVAEAARLEKERRDKEALAAKQKEEEEKRQAEARKAEQTLKEAEAARLAKQKEEEAKRVAQTTKNETQPVTQPANVTKTSLPKDVVVKLGNNIDVDFVLAEGGTFMMGTDRAKLNELAKPAGADEKDFADEVPAHKVDVSSFYISKTPVTVAQFRRFVDVTGYRTSAEKAGAAYVLRDREWKYTPGASWAKPGFSQRDDHPVVMLSWRDCDAFARWASAESGRQLRLPTEAEWEYAARGPRSSTYPWGETWDGRMANHGDKRLQPYSPPDWYTSRFDDGFPFTAPVQKFVNASWCGALDMAGNVWQWCSDAYEPYPQSSKAPTIIVDSSEVPPDAKRVLRGGSWLLRGFECRSAARRGASPRSASCEFGLRLVMTAPAAK